MGRKFHCFNKKSKNDSLESQRSVHLILRNDDKAAGGGKGERGKGGKGGGMGKSDAKWPHTLCAKHGFFNLPFKILPVCHLLESWAGYITNGFYAKGSKCWWMWIGWRWRNTFFQIKLNFTPSDIIPFMVVASISTNPISFVVPLFQSGFPKIVTNFRHYVIRSVTPYCDKIYFVNTLQSDFRTFVMRSCLYLGINASFLL